MLSFLRENYGLPDIHTDRLPVARAYSGVGLTDWNEALEIIEYGSPEQVLLNYLYKKGFQTVV